MWSQVSVGLGFPKSSLAELPITLCSPNLPLKWVSLFTLGEKFLAQGLESFNKWPKK